MVGGRKGRMGEIREGFLEKVVFKQRGGESASHVRMCSKGILGGGSSHCNPKQECAGSVSGTVRGP